MGNDYLRLNKQHQQLSPRPVDFQFPELMGNNYGTFEEQPQQLLPGPVNNQFSAPIGNSYSMFHKQYDQLLSNPWDHHFSDAGQHAFKPLEQSLTSATIVPQSPRQKVSATFANNPDTFNPSVLSEFHMFNQPIQGSATCTGSGLDDGMHNPAWFSDWMPSASTCGIQEESGHSVNQIARPTHEQDVNKIYDNILGSPPSPSHHLTEGNYVIGKFYLQYEPGSRNKLMISDQNMMRPSQSQSAGSPTSTVQFDSTFAPPLSDVPQTSVPALHLVAPAQPIAPAQHISPGRPRQRRTYQG